MALAFLGGAGLLAYVAAVLLIPKEGEGGRAPEAPNRGLAIAGVVLLVVAIGVVLPFHGGWGAGWGLLPLGFIALAGLFVWRLASGQRPEGDARAVLRAMALGVALLAACFVLAIGAAWASAAGGNGVVAGIVIAAGLALIAGAFVGSWARWLILPALAVALPAGVVAAADLDVTGGTGEVKYRPASAAEVHDSYRLGVGHLVVDLRDAHLTAGDHRIKIRLGVGGAELLVPPGVCVSTDSHVGIGGTSVFNRSGGGIDADWTDERSAPEGTPRVVIDGDVGIGALIVASQRARALGRRAGQQGVRMNGRRPDLPAFVAGVGLVVLGAVLMADALDAIHLSFAAFAPLACFLVGDILLAAGLTRRD